MTSILGSSHNEQVLFFDPGCASLNLGDEIISDSASRYLLPLFSNKYVVRLSTHQKVSIRYGRYLRDSYAGFVLGSNLLKSGMLFGFRQWDISIVNSLQIADLVLVGCGWQNYTSKVGLYSRLLYKRLLSKHYMHSVRDEYTKQKLEYIGFKNVINTGCPTLWALTPEHCSAIPRTKSSMVVTTVTDYRRDPVRDRIMLEELFRSYESVYVWIQGSSDIEYLKQLELSNHYYIVPPSLCEFDKLVSNNTDIEYVGTRLHGGIRCLQHGRRAIIISIDNRAREMSRDYGLPILEREDINLLHDLIGTDFDIDIKIDSDAIDQFLSQFD